MYISEENKLKIFILSIMFAGLAIVLGYHRYSLKQGADGESEQLLFQIGKSYEYEIKSEFDKCTSLSDLLVQTIVKNFDNQNFNKDIKDIFSDLIYKNSRIQSIEFVVKETDVLPDSSRNLLIPAENSQKKSIRLYKSKSGISESSNLKDFGSENLKVTIEKAIITDQTIILSPENIQDDGRPMTVVPVLSTIYKGKQFLGYVIINVSVNWMSKSNYQHPEILEFSEIFVSSPDGIIVTLNNNSQMIAEPIEKVCASCKDLLGNKGQEFNINNTNDYITICSPWQPIPNAGYWNICVRAPRVKISSYLQYNAPYSLIVALVVLILAASAIVVVLKRYSQSWKGLETLALSILNGEKVVFDDGHTTGSLNKQIGLKNTLNQIAKGLQLIITINTKAKSGDFNSGNDSGFRNHPAIKSSIDLHMYFKSRIETLEAENLNLKQIKQLTEGLDRINVVLKQHHDDLQQLSIHVIHTLVDLLDIEMGAVFLVKTNNNMQFLELIVSYAYSENRFQKRTFNMGESLVGACAAEKRTIFLKKVPEDYLKIISGLGLASPKSILIVPLVFEGVVLGVLELGSLKDIDQNKVSFTEKAAETIANTLSMAEINIKTSNLLEQTKQQALELELHDKKMIETLSELNDLQIKTATSEASVRAKLDAMNNTLMIVEYTSRGILLDANCKYLNTMNFTLEDIVGIDVLELLKETERAELIKIINSVKNGNFYEGVMRRHTRHGEEKWLLATYTPVYDDRNVVESILFFGIDITRLRKNENLLKQKVNELNKQVEELRELLKKNTE